jgi:hypothetical protein
MENKDDLKLYKATVIYPTDNENTILFIAKDEKEAIERFKKFEKWLEEKGEHHYINWYLHEINKVEGHKIKVE